MSALPKIPEYDYSNRLSRQYRQPQGIADFVLIDPHYFNDYANMVTLYERLPFGIAMAKDKGEKSNRFYSKTQVADFTHFTPNVKKFIHALVFDIDPKDGEFNFMKWVEVGLPPPNLIICNPDKPNSVQYIYLLKYPVRAEANPTAKKYLDNLYACMRDLLGADRNFARTRSKNPFNASHDTYVSGAEPYDLTTLADKSDYELYDPNKGFLATFSKPSIIVPDKAVKAVIDQLKPYNAPKFTGKEFITGFVYWQDGRNGATFEYVRWKAYVKAHLIPEDLYDYVFNECCQYQKRFDTPLSDRECGDIAKSIVRFCVEKWGAGTGRATKYKRNNKLTPRYTHTSEEQSYRSKQRWKGYDDKKIQALEMLKNKVKKVDICKQLSITKPTLNAWEKEQKPTKNISKIR